MAQRGSLAEGKHRSHPAPLTRQAPVADGEDATVEAVQATGAHAEVDRADAEARRSQLAEVHNPVLHLGELRDPRIRSNYVANVLHMNT